MLYDVSEQCALNLAVQLQGHKCQSELSSGRQRLYYNDFVACVNSAACHDFRVLPSNLDCDISVLPHELGILSPLVIVAAEACDPWRVLLAPGGCMAAAVTCDCTVRLGTCHCYMFLAGHPNQLWQPACKHCIRAGRPAEADCCCLVICFVACSAVFICLRVVLPMGYVRQQTCRSRATR
jgi:hypothetical protein